MLRLSAYDVQRARAVDLLAMLNNHTAVRRVASSGGGEWAGPCPLCGGRDRFRVQPACGRWLCRKCTPRWEDAITLQRALTGQSFSEAVCALLGAHGPAIRPHRDVPAQREPPSHSHVWQVMAMAVAGSAATHLWSRNGQPALDWLHGRGLNDDTLRYWRIGWQPRNQWFAAQRWGLAGRPLVVATGVTIPYLSGRAARDSALGEARPAPDPTEPAPRFSNPAFGRALKVRRFDPRRSKYVWVRGSEPGLYLAQTVAHANMVCLAEGELDALLLWQVLQASRAGSRISVVSTGSQSLYPRADWLQCLEDKSLLLMHHQDEAGELGAARWRAVRPDAVRVRWSVGKDLTEHRLAGGDLVALIEQAQFHFQTTNLHREPVHV